MSRSFTPLVVGLLALVPALPAPAAESLAGNWRLSMTLNTPRGEQNVAFLFGLAEADGKWSVKLIEALPQQLADSTVEAVVRDEAIKLTVKSPFLPFNIDGRLAADGKRIKGSMDLGGRLSTIELVRTKLSSLSKDRLAVVRESLDLAEDASDYFSSLIPVLRLATELKLKPEEVRGYADKAAKFAEAYGGRWQRYMAFRMADLLAEQAAYAAIAVEQARQGERLLARGDDIATQMQVLESVARVLRKAKKEADAKEVEGRLAKLEPRDYAEFVKSSPIKADEFKGRKAKSDRAVLVEFFTMAEMEDAVMVHHVYDSLLQAFKPTDVVFLQYHIHPDPLTAKDGPARFDYYPARKGEGPPQIFFNGKPERLEDAGPKQARLSYLSFRETLEGLVEKPASVKLTLSASRKGDEIAIKANVTDLAKPGDKVSLRFALVEDRVRYAGSNGVRYHQNVVRSMPGGAKGFPLPKAAQEQSLTVKLTDVRAEYNKGLDDFVALARRQEPTFNFPDRPFALRNLKVVAFVQNDETREVLQAVQVEVEGKE